MRERVEMIEIAEDVVVQVTWRKVRRVTMRVQPPFGTLVASCPLRMSRADITGILASRVGWLRSTQASVKTQYQHQASVDTALAQGGNLDGFEFPYLGATWTLAVMGEEGRKRGVSRADYESQTLRVQLPSAQMGDAAAQMRWIDRFYKETLEAALPESLAHWQAKIGVRVKDVCFRRMTSRWGSCQTKTQVITLNTKLAQYPLKYFDQVVLHELVHLRVPNHGPDFYRLMDRCLPEWQTLRRDLRRLPF